MLGKQKNRVTIVVLGDVARSPRMLYHALALAAGPAAVDLVGHLENPLPEAIRDHQRITRITSYNVCYTKLLRLRSRLRRRRACTSGSRKSTPRPHGSATRLAYRRPIMSVSFRHYRGGDEVGIVDLWRRSLWKDPINADRFRIV